MALCQVSFFSGVLQKQVGMNVIVPEKGKGPFATFYLLHGLSDDYTGWHHRTRIEPYANKWPLIVVMPDGYRGFYTDNEEGPAYGKFFSTELPAFVERTFDAKSSRSARCVGGLSMGGYGALRLALSHPELFASANSHSAPAAVVSVRYSRTKQAERARVFGVNPIGSRHDLNTLARKAKSAGRLPKLQIDCGVSDSLLEANRAFHAELERLGIPHEYAEYPGKHDWNYWDLHVHDALLFHAKALGISPHAE